jgi:hypothetical protein
MSAKGPAELRILQRQDGGLAVLLLAERAHLLIV